MLEIILTGALATLCVAWVARSLSRIRTMGSIDYARAERETANAILALRREPRSAETERQQSRPPEVLQRPSIPRRLR